MDHSLDIMQKTIVDFCNSQPIKVEDVQATISQVLGEVLATTGGKFELEEGRKDWWTTPVGDGYISWLTHKCAIKEFMVQMEIRRSQPERRTNPRDVILSIYANEKSKETVLDVCVGNNASGFCPSGVQQRQ